MKVVLAIFLLALYHSYGQRAAFTHIDFEKADSVALVHKGKSLKNLPLLTYNLTHVFTKDVEKFRAIYTWVCTNIANDYSAYQRTSAKRKKLAKDRAGFLAWNSSFTPKMFQKLLKTKKTACTGYAYLIKEMTHLAGLKCKIVDGYGRTATLRLRENSTANHSWNAVLLNNNWYLCDATWSAGQIIFEEDIPKFKPHYTDGYFLAEPKLFLKNHYPIDAKWALLDSVPSFTEFIAGPVVYKEAFAKEITPLAPIKLHSEIRKTARVSFTLECPKNILKNELDILLVHNNKKVVVPPEITSDNTTVTLNYQFNKAGYFDVHLRYKEAILATYVVRVKRK